MAPPQSRAPCPDQLDAVLPRRTRDQAQEIRLATKDNTAGVGTRMRERLEDRGER